MNFEGNKLGNKYGSFIINIEDNFSNNFRLIHELGRFCAKINKCRRRLGAGEIVYEYYINEIVADSDESIRDCMREFVSQLIDFIDVTNKDNSRKCFIRTTLFDDHKLIADEFVNSFASEVVTEKRENGDFYTIVQIEI